MFANKSQAVGSLSLNTTSSSYSIAPPSSSLRGFTTHVFPLQIPITEQQAIDPAHVGDFTSGSALSLVCLVATFHRAAVTVTVTVKIIINAQSGMLTWLSPGGVMQMQRLLTGHALDKCVARSDSRWRVAAALTRGVCLWRAAGPTGKDGKSLIIQRPRFISDAVAFPNHTSRLN